MTLDAPTRAKDRVTVSVGERTYKMVLPERETDYIQGRIAQRGEPYEPEMLADMASRISAGDVVVDAGANVGNHTIYLAAIARCRVEAFEPDPALADAISRSARANRLTKAVRVHTVALGAVPGKGTLVTPDRSNIGGQHVRLGDGEVQVCALDDVDLPRPVRAIKIDVEGMELDVLRGAEALVTADRPLLYVECATEAAFGAVAAWLDEHGYAYWDTYNATPTHLFLPAEGIASDQLARRLLLKTVRDGFRAAEVAQGLRGRLDQANLKYRSSTQVFETLRQQHAEVGSRLTATEQKLAAARSAQEEGEHLRAEERTRNEGVAATAAAALAGAEAARDTIAHDLEALTSHVERYRADVNEARRELSDVRTELDGAQCEFADRAAAVAAAEARVDELGRVRKESVSERNALLARLAEEQAAQQQLKAQVGVLDEDAHALRAALERGGVRLAEQSEELVCVVRDRDAAVARLHQSLEEQAIVAERAARSAERVAARDDEFVVLRQRLDDLDRSVRSAWAESGHLRAAITRRRGEAEQLGFELQTALAQRDEALRLLAAAVAGEHAARARDQEAREREQRARESELSARAEVRSLRASVTFRTGREIRRGTTSFWSAAMLPARLWHISRESLDNSRQAAVSAVDVPVETSSLPAHRSTGPVLPDLTSHVAPAAPPPSGRLRVAAIVDEFTSLSLEPECDMRHLTPTNWHAELEASRPQLLFVESAWRGKGGVWHNTVGLFPVELRGIVEWCQARGIPTAFWNKEDPVHFSTFLTTARAFDHVFTTDIDCIGRYKAAFGHDRVYLLPFAAQPRTHHPLEEVPRKDAISFAGAYYRRYPERTRDLDNFLKHLPGFRPVEIFDRNFGSDDPDYAFPEAYQRYVVGTLPPEEIARAYKGYRYAINLNSVKQSQTMFARRAFELLASNTITVSNFSRGLRLLFGDLVVTTDSGREAARRLSELGASQERLDHLRLLALRSVMSQHTYADRLAYVVSKVTGTPVPDPLPLVAFVGRARNRDEVDAVLAAVARQRGVRHRLVLVLDAGLERPDVPGVTVVRAEAARDVEVASVVGGAGLVGALHAQDHYGRDYAFDLALGTRYCDADVLGKRTRYVVDGVGVALTDLGAEYRRAGRLPVRSSLVRTSAVAAMSIGELCAAADDDGVHAEGLDQVSLDHFSYCRDGAGLHVAQDVDADDAGVWSGMPLAELQARAEAAPPTEEPGDGLNNVSADQIEAWLSAAVRPALRHERTSDGWMVTSELPDGKHDYIYADEPVPVQELWAGTTAEAYLDTTPGLRLQAVFLFIDADGVRVGTFFAAAQQNASAEIPDGTVWVKVGFRALGPGSTTVRRIVLGQVSTEPGAVVTTGDALVVTNHYPTYDDLYRNAFVNTRVHSYRARGIRADVFRFRPGHVLGHDEFEGVDVVTGSDSALRKVLKGGRHRAVLVHFLDSAMWSVVRQIDPAVPVAVWIHGADVQPWWRRSFNYKSEAEIETAKNLSEVRMAFWREVFTAAPPNVVFVFVSEFLARTTLEDVGVELPRDRYQILHNPIDVDLFRYEAKGAEQRLRVLSIRPYASRVYANDLSVAAIQRLREESCFDEFEFCLVGDGPLFEETVEPVRDLPNVRLDRRFLPQHEIAALHRAFGVFLVPSRMDTQGVSRDEAMSSGLVPVTTAVAAVPEFVDENSGILVEPEDAEGLAQALMSLRDDPRLFARLSAAAAARVRKQSAAALITERELSIVGLADGLHIKRTSGSPR